MPKPKSPCPRIVSTLTSRPQTFATSAPEVAWRKVMSKSHEIEQSNAHKSVSARLDGAPISAGRLVMLSLAAFHSPTRDRLAYAVTGCFPRAFPRRRGSCRSALPWRCRPPCRPPPRAKRTATAASPTASLSRSHAAALGRAARARFERSPRVHLPRDHAPTKAHGLCNLAEVRVL